MLHPVTSRHAQDAQAVLPDRRRAERRWPCSSRHAALSPCTVVQYRRRCVSVSAMRAPVQRADLPGRPDEGWRAQRVSIGWRWRLHARPSNTSARLGSADPGSAARNHDARGRSAFHRIAVSIVRDEVRQWFEISRWIRLHQRFAGGPGVGKFDEPKRERRATDQCHHDWQRCVAMSSREMRGMEVNHVVEGAAVSTSGADHL